MLRMPVTASRPMAATARPMIRSLAVALPDRGARGVTNQGEIATHRPASIPSAAGSWAAVVHGS